MKKVLNWHCPLCDQRYRTSPGAFPCCPSCQHEITYPNATDEVPRIAPDPKTHRNIRWLFITGFICIFIYPFGSILGVALILPAILLSQRSNYRCGNCGTDLASNRTRDCKTCGAEFKFLVR